jgi:lipoprotein NlpI
MVSGATNIESPRQFVLQGMQRFRQGDIDGSIELFDRAESLDSSLRPFLWQRGISYYYADQFQKGSDQVTS